MKGWQHFKTITKHKAIVMEGCFRVGLYKQGLLHDLSKYMPSEFLIGALFYQGNRSPNNAERELAGYSSAWLHHKGRNKHHYEYWIDYSASDIKGGMKPAPMPTKYIVEMFMDRRAACIIYHGKDYRDTDPLEYYNKGKGNALLHEKTRYGLEKLLNMLAEKGEEETFSYIRKVLKRTRIRDKYRKRKMKEKIKKLSS